MTPGSRFQWAWGVRRGSAAVRLLGMWIRTPSGKCLSLVNTVRQRSLRRVDHLYRRTLSSAVCLGVFVKLRRSEDHVPPGAVEPRKKKTGGKMAQNTNRRSIEPRIYELQSSVNFTTIFFPTKSHLFTTSVVVAFHSFCPVSVFVYMDRYVYLCTC